jgi:hypothetical protein
VVALLLRPPTMLIVAEALFVASTRSEAASNDVGKFRSLRPFMLS